MPPWIVGLIDAFNTAQYRPGTLTFRFWELVAAQISNCKAAGTLEPMIALTLASLLLGPIHKTPRVQTETSIPVLSGSGLKEDLALLHRAFKSLHPGLYRYNTKKQIDSAFSELSREFEKGESLADAYLGFSRLCARIRCGHTYPNFYNQGKIIERTLLQRSDRVPFFFRWLGRKMIVTKDFTPDKSLPPGTEIESINRVGTPAILRRLLTYVRGDGANDYKRIDLLQVQGDDTYSEFDVYYSLVYRSSVDGYRLEVLRPNDRAPQWVTVKPLTYAERKAAVKLDPAGDAPLFNVEYPKDGVAVLNMPTWEMYKTKWHWREWLNQTLDEIAEKGCKALVVDLRGNEGGDDVGSIILQRFSPTVNADKFLPLVRFQQLPDEFRPWAKEWDGSPWNDKAWIASTSALQTPVAAAPAGVTYYLRKEDDDETAPASPSRRLSCKLMVLVDSSVSSATFNFSHAVQANHLGTVIGEPTGGNQRGINGGQFIFIRLPYSKIEVDIPLVGTFPTSPQPNGGLMPDVRVQVTAKSVAAGTDPIFGKALQLIGAEK